MKNRIKALAQHLDCKKSEVVHLYDNTFEAEGGEYLTLLQKPFLTDKDIQRGKVLVGSLTGGTRN